MIPGITAGGASNPWTPVTGPFAQAGQIVSDGGILRLVGLGEGSASKIWESWDGGVGWIGTPLGFPNSPGSMVVTSSRVVILGSSGVRGRHKPLTTGGTITNSTPEPIQNALESGMVYNGSRIVLVAGSSTTTNYSIVSDNEGTSWTQTHSWAATDWARGIAYGDGYFYINFYQSNRFYYSTDGTTWSVGTLPVPAVTTWLTVVKDSIAYMIDQVTGDVYSSAVGEATMTLLVAGTPIRARAKVIDGAIYARGLDGRTLVKTTDFLTFITYPRIPVGAQIADFTIMGGLVYVGGSPSGVMYSLPII